MFKTLPRMYLLILLLVGSSYGAWALKFQSDLTPIRINGRPGQVISRSFSLSLAKDEQRSHFKTHVEDWWRSEDGKQSFYRQPGTLSHSCAAWVKLNPVEAAVAPGDVLDVRVSVAIPEDAKPGGYWCVLTVDEVPDPLQISPEGVGLRFLTSISLGIFVYISPVERAARITEVQVLPDHAIVKLRNDGNCPLAVEGRFEFMRPGETKPTAVAHFARGTVLPEPVNTALFTAMLPDSAALPSGRYLVQAILDIGLDHYIGVRKELEINREAPSPAASEGH